MIILTKQPINADYSIFSKKNERNPKVRKFKVNDRVEL